MSTTTRYAREQIARERAEREAREGRIRRIAADNPDLTLDMLAERFGETIDRVRDLLPRGDGQRRYAEDPLRTHRPRRRRSA